MLGHATRRLSASLASAVSERSPARACGRVQSISGVDLAFSFFRLASRQLPDVDDEAPGPGDAPPLASRASASRRSFVYIIEGHIGMTLSRKSCTEQEARGFALKAKARQDKI